MPKDASDDGDHRATSLETLRQMVAGRFGCTLPPALAALAMAAGEAGVRTIPLAGEGGGAPDRPGLPAGVPEG